MISNRIKVWSYFICTKFREMISNHIKVMMYMISMPEIKKGNNSANNVSGVTTFNLCKMAGHALYCTKFCEIISNSIKVIEQTPFLY